MARIYPSYDDTMAACQALARGHAEFVRLEEPGKSEEGRGIPLLTVTDPAVPAGDKAVLMVVGGMHGSEEAGRAIAAALAAWLVEPHNRLHLRRQCFVIMPCANPDGALLNTYHNARDVNVARGYELWQEPTASIEARTLWDVARRHVPDAFVDCHGLAGGGMGDGEHIYTGYGPSFGLKSVIEVVGEMDQAAELAGYPQREPNLQDYKTPPPETLARKLFSECHTFAMVMETTENYYPIEETVRSGLARLTRLVEIGERVHYFQPYPNYPCDVITGDRMAALMPLGRDYATRRVNRALATRMIYEGVPHFQRMPADQGRVARVFMPLLETVKTRPPGLVVQLTIDGRAAVGCVTWNGKPLSQTDAEGGWTVRREGPGIIVRAQIAEPPVIGDNLLEVKYSVPFKAHVEPGP